MNLKSHFTQDFTSSSLSRLRGANSIRQYLSPNSSQSVRLLILCTVEKILLLTLQTPSIHLSHHSYIVLVH
ncbi:CLUMA_CG000693, isoform A [Clunio marinus]|uniref:CLUMA_CG000693, isoform A n=1 Tax=Clunio marinus TaxID=568069 RepID=A0A1J1HG72_9DIPT|nr:CLUMA_CG000693, isoform A [Clunio marinus]